MRRILCVNPRGTHGCHSTIQAAIDAVGAAGAGMFANPGAPPGADNNVITDNVIAGNGGDEEAEPASPNSMGIELLSNGSFAPFAPAAPIVGTLISGNQISGEDFDVWVGNTATNAQVSVNNLIGRNAIGVKNRGSGTVTATDNWWGCPQGPNAGNCSSTSGVVVSSPFASHPVNGQH
jgi:hypothetical protein